MKEVLLMEIKIRNDYITLGQFMKLTDFIQSGGEAKAALQELEITVNGVVENRRGRKLYSGDQVVIEGHAFLIQ